MRDAELRREFRRYCKQRGLPLHIDINGRFFGTIDAEDIFQIYADRMQEQRWAEEVEDIT